MEVWEQEISNFRKTDSHDNRLSYKIASLCYWLLY